MSFPEAQIPPLLGEGWIYWRSGEPVSGTGPDLFPPEIPHSPAIPLIVGPNRQSKMLPVSCNGTTGTATLGADRQEDSPGEIDTD